MGILLFIELQLQPWKIWDEKNVIFFLTQIVKVALIDVFFEHVS